MAGEEVEDTASESNNTPMCARNNEVDDTDGAASERLQLAENGMYRMPVAEAQEVPLFSAPSSTPSPQSSFKDDNTIISDGQHDKSAVATLVLLPPQETTTRTPMIQRIQSGTAAAISALYWSSWTAHRHSSRPAWRRCHLVIYFLTMAFITVAIGAKWQHVAANRSEGTTHLYQTGSICGMERIASSAPTENPTEEEDARNGLQATSESADEYDPNEETITFVTFDSMQSMEDGDAENTTTVAHCGDCGQCSNPHDMKIYEDTKTTLFRDTLRCSKKSVLGGPRAVRRCLAESVGFTTGCNECWVENVMCDERRCGPAFLKCAGANRRRSGILSEFQRDDDNEVCKEVDVGWWQDEDLQQLYQEQMAPSLD